MKNIYKMFMLVFVAVLALPGLVNGQAGGNSGGLSISPTRFEFVIERGEAELMKIQVENVTDTPIVAQAFLNDFEPDGDSSSPKLIIDSEERSASSLRDFIVGLEDVTIAPNDTEIVSLPIQVPDNAAPGAYYGAVRFQAATEVSESAAPQLSLNASVAAIVLVEVPGNILEKIEVANVSAFLEDSKGSLFTKKPTEVGISINNLGNGFSKPFGAVVVSGPWGAGEVLSYELNDISPRGNVLPDSARLFMDELSGISAPGRYTIQANISHGNGGEILTVTSSFWYLPVWFLLAVLVGLLVLVMLSYRLYRKHVTKSTRRR